MESTHVIERRAIFYMIFATMAFSIMNSIVRYVDHLPTFELVFFRSVGTVFCCIVVLVRYKIPILGNQKPLLLLRATIGVMSLALFFSAIRLMPIGTAVSLRYLAPIFSAILAVIFLKEHIKALQWFFFGTAFLGVLLLKGFDPRISVEGLIIILSSAVLTGAVYVIIRKIGDRDHPVVVINYFMFVAMIVGAIVSFFNWVSPIGVEWVLLISLGLFGFVAQYFMTRALQMAEANLVTPFKYSEVVFTLIAGWIIYGEKQGLMSILAILIIVCSLIANVLVKRHKKLEV